MSRAAQISVQRWAQIVQCMPGFREFPQRNSDLLVAKEATN